MEDFVGRIAVSTAGHDKGLVLCVIGTDGNSLLLADGRHRKVQKPKRKQLKHLVFIEDAALYSGRMTNKSLRAHIREVCNHCGHVPT